MLSKCVSNIYLKVTIEKKWHTQNFILYKNTNSNKNEMESK